MLPSPTKPPTKFDPACLCVDDPITDSPVGPGVVTDFTERGFPRVNHIAVTWCTRTDGLRFDPYNHVGGSRGPSAVILPFKKPSNETLV